MTDIVERMTRRMVQTSNIEEAPSDVWLEFSVSADGDDPCLEYDWLEPQTDRVEQAIRYTQADTIDMLVEALDDCECELNEYYNVEYGGDHPYSRKKLANAIKCNPATEALAKLKGEGDD